MTEILRLLQQGKSFEQIFEGKTQQEIEKLIAENDYKTAQVLAEENNFEAVLRLFPYLRGVNVEDYIYQFASSLDINRLEMLRAGNCEILYQAFRHKNQEAIIDLAKFSNGAKFMFFAQNKENEAFVLGRLSTCDANCLNSFFENVDIVSFFKEMTRAERYFFIGFCFENKVFKERLKNLDDVQKFYIATYALSLKQDIINKNFCGFYSKMLDICPKQLCEISRERNFLKEILLHEYFQEHSQSPERPLRDYKKYKIVFCTEIMLQAYSALKNVIPENENVAKLVAGQVFDYILENSDKMRNLYDISRSVSAKYTIPPETQSNIYKFSDILLERFEPNLHPMQNEVLKDLCKKTVSKVLGANDLTQDRIIVRAAEQASQILERKRVAEVANRANIDFYAPKPKPQPKSAQPQSFDRNNLFL